MTPEAGSLWVVRVLDRLGDGTGATNANVNGSIKSVSFKINPLSAGSVKLVRLVMSIHGGPSTSTGSYGARNTALTNGVQIGMFAKVDDSLVVDYLKGTPIKSSAEWVAQGLVVDPEAWGGSNKTQLLRWTFPRDMGVPLLKKGGPNYFGVKIRDDLSTVIDHRFTLYGRFRRS